MKRIFATTALAFLAAPATAQEAPICGGISLVGEWLGGSPDGSDLTNAQAPFDAEGVVPIAGHMVRMFTLSAPTDVRVEVKALPAGDPYLAVYDASGQEVAADDDGGGDFAARAEARLEPGSYCVAARSYESGVTSVALRVGLQSQAPLTGTGDGGGSVAADAPDAAPATPRAAGAGCDAADVARIGDGLTVAGMTGGLTLSGSANDVPGRAFSLAEAMPVTITATSVDGDPLIRLRDASGGQLAENDDADGLNSRIDLTSPLAPGEYCLEVEDLNDGTDDIEVTLTAFDPAADRRARLDRAEFAPGPGDTVPVAELGAVETSLIHDATASGAAQWMRVSVPEGGMLVVEAIASDVDPIVTLFDRVGRRIGENDDGPAGLDSFLAVRVLPGDYLLALRSVDESASGPVRVLFERYVPAR